MLIKTLMGAGGSNVPATEIISAMEPVAGSHSPKVTDTRSGAINFLWSPTQTFSNSPTAAATAAHRYGTATDITFTPLANVANLNLPTTTAIAWSQTTPTTPPSDNKIDGVTVADKTSLYYQTVSSGVGYRSKFTVFRSTAPLTTSTLVSSTFSATSNSGINNKSGFFLLPSSWDYTSLGSAMTGSGSVTIPANTLAMFICNGATDGLQNLFNFGTNTNLAWLYNMNTYWYDNCQVVFVGNKTNADQAVTYTISANSVDSPIPVFFNLV